MRDMLINWLVFFLMDVHEEVLIMHVLAVMNILKKEKMLQKAECILKTPLNM